MVTLYKSPVGEDVAKVVKNALCYLNRRNTFKKSIPTMYSYAISLSCVGPSVTQEAAKALHDSRLSQAEIQLRDALRETDDQRVSLDNTRELLQSGAMRSAGVHLPFAAKDGWIDPSSLDEATRRHAVKLFERLIRENADLLAPQMTMHASMEPIPPDERKARLDQCRRSIGELLPLAKEFGFSLNVEYLPRTCLGNSPEELEYLTEPFDPRHVGICLDVNHVMGRHGELPSIVTRLAPRLRTFHLSDYDGVDEMHWFPGQGIIDWPALMTAIRAIDHTVLLIYETVWQLGARVSHVASPAWAVRQVENSIWFLENCPELMQRMNAFQIPALD